MSLITVNDYKIKKDILDADGKPCYQLYQGEELLRDTTNLSEIIAYMCLFVPKINRLMSCITISSTKKQELKQILNLR